MSTFDDYKQSTMMPLPEQQLDCVAKDSALFRMFLAICCIAIASGTLNSDQANRVKDFINEYA